MLAHQLHAAINEGIAELIIRKFANKLGRVEDTAYMTGSGTGQLTNIVLLGDPVRYVRLVQTGTAAQWWTVADLRAYR